ncbi:helix-turn-helix protein [Nocardiopsis sp. Huas11]|uniref:helix-turn-helix transcriptional regulator n=1 Tax=Nocardiopsis sp. Huas11 TaxID=2183912 RepID=UPI000EB4C855|nr:helix-turn-helix transcriptional regulator [Nocardiopsis sp. Huas11]RKS08678.1 helix-turn-helix protein [Nocardiopsis sp. Huas11]
MDTDNPLGRFLRARRALTSPQQTGLPQTGRRRVPGLRREEVAILSGVSTDYYVRLEQGRERSPSAQVVDALARTLDLDEDARAHLHRLAHPTGTVRRPAPGDERVSAALVSMMAGWHRTPALILGRRLNVLAHNALGAALFDGHTHSRDLLRLVFLDPSAREFYPDWEQIAAGTVAALRAGAAEEADDPRFAATVGELCLKSEEFARLWARHDVRHKTHASKRFHHRLVGELTLDYETLTVNSAPGQQLVVYQAAPDSTSEQALALLGSLTASDSAARDPHPAPER